jgi:hypothetical protein
VTSAPESAETGEPPSKSPRWVQILVLLLAVGVAAYLIIAAQQEHNPHAVELQAPAAAVPAIDASSSGTRDAAASSSKSMNKFGIAGPSSKADPHMAREDALRQAVETGILRLVDSGAAE